MALTDAHWNKIMEALPIAAGGSLTDPGRLLVAFKKNWELFSDEAALDLYIESQRLVQMKAARDARQAEMDRLDAEIKELEG